MKCPSCSVVSAETEAECPSCGLLFSKWRDLEEKRKRLAEEPLAAGESPSAAVFFLMQRGRQIAVVVVAVWLLGLAIYSYRALRGRREGQPIRPGDTVSVRDPETGEMRQMKVTAAESSSSPHPAPPVEAEPKDGRVVKESEWIEEEGKEPAAPESQRTVLPTPPPGDE